MIQTWRLAALALALSMAALAERAWGEGIHSLEAGVEYYSFDYRERQALAGLPILPILGVKGEW